jgi:hypothetical protein
MPSVPPDDLPDSSYTAMMAAENKGIRRQAAPARRLGCAASAPRAFQGQAFAERGEDGAGNSPRTKADPPPARRQRLRTALLTVTLGWMREPKEMAAR